MKLFLTIIIFILQKINEILSLIYKPVLIFIRFIVNDLCSKRYWQIFGKMWKDNCKKIGLGTLLLVGIPVILYYIGVFTEYLLSEPLLRSDLSEISKIIGLMFVGFITLFFIACCLFLLNIFVIFITYVIVPFLQNNWELAEQRSNKFMKRFNKGKRK